MVVMQQISYYMVLCAIYWIMALYDVRARELLHATM